MATNISKDLKNRLLQMYKEGYSTNAIARELGVNKSTVYRNTLKAGLREKQDAPERLTEAHIEQLRDLYVNTLIPLKHLQVKLCVSQDSIYKYTAGLERIGYTDEYMSQLVEQFDAGEISDKELKEMGITMEYFYTHYRRYYNAV